MTLLTRAQWNAMSAEQMLRAAALLVTRQVLVRYACLCAREAFVPNEDRLMIVVIETAEAWTRGEATIEQVRTAVGGHYDTCAARRVASHAAAILYAAYATIYAAYATDAARCAQQAGVPLQTLADIVRPLWHDVDEAQISKLSPEAAAAHLCGRRHHTSGELISLSRLETADSDERERLEAASIRVEVALGVHTEAVR